ncbi:PulJ/GspJ family protein, partial [Staphylococcus aureus]
MRGAGERGFTLLEILVALVVLGFLLAGLAQGTRFGLQAWGMQTRNVLRQADMDGTYRVLRAMVEAADPGEVNQSGT